MKKIFYAAAAATAIMTAAGAQAQGPDPKGNFNRENEKIHNYYRNGRITDVRHSMFLTENLWSVDNRKSKQIWTTVNTEGQNIIVKLKGNDYKSFTKAKGWGEREFVKNIEPVNKKKHVAKIRENNKRYVKRNAGGVNGADMVLEK